MDHTQDINIVELWLRKDTVRWVSGALAGLFAGLVAICFAMLLAVMSGAEFWYPVKLMATMVLGSSATVLGAHMGAILTGFILFELLSVLLGVIYAHFTASNSLSVLLGIGLVWGMFSWIFIWNLFFQSFKTIFAANVSSGAVFPICMVFGLALTSVGFFDRAIRGTDL
jgi:hypothetical protein